MNKETLGEALTRLFLSQETMRFHAKAEYPVSDFVTLGGLPRKTPTITKQDFLSVFGSLSFPGTFFPKD